MQTAIKELTSLLKEQKEVLKRLHESFEWHKGTANGLEKEIDVTEKAIKDLEETIQFLKEREQKNAN